MPLQPRTTSAASVTPIAGGWRLQIPDGKAEAYRLAQLDDYASLPRGRFPFRTPTSLSLRCRVSEATLPGTWGFGFWNDPFAFSFGLQGTAWRLPVFPNATWFFYASAENYLSFAPGTPRNLPANGFLAQSFCSPKIPPALLAPGILGLPFIFSRTISKWLRVIAGKIIREDSLALAVEVTEWHTYQLAWRKSEVTFSLDGAAVFETPISPRGPLALVLWIDNQYAAWTPEGKIGFGTLPNKSAAWMEIEQIEVG